MELFCHSTQNRTLWFLVYYGPTLNNTMVFLLIHYVSHGTVAITNSLCIVLYDIYLSVAYIKLDNIDYTFYSISLLTLLNHNVQKPPLSGLHGTILWTEIKTLSLVFSALSEHYYLLFFSWHNYHVYSILINCLGR